VAVLGGDAPFLDTVRSIARDYPQLILEVHASDPLPPADELDVVLCPARVADAIWDRCITITGGPSVSPGASCSNEIAVFESDPVGDRGAAPPGMILAGAMMLEHINEGVAADRIVKAVKGALESKADPRQFADEVIRRMQRN
jgi:isocitrate/isopropylmalate dehydrogenase